MDNSGVTKITPSTTGNSIQNFQSIKKVVGSAHRIRTTRNSLLLNRSN